MGDVGVVGEGSDLAIVSYANSSYFLSRQAQQILSDKHGIDTRVIDLRWLAPLDFTKIIQAIGPAKQVLIVDECRRTGSQSEGLMAGLAEQAPHLSLSRIAAEDSFISAWPGGDGYLAKPRGPVLAAALAGRSAARPPAGAPESGSKEARAKESRSSSVQAGEPTTPANVPAISPASIRAKPSFWRWQTPIAPARASRP